MSTVLLLVLLSVGGSTVLGVFGGLLVRRIPHRFNDAVLGFAAGVMLAASVLGLLAPAFAVAGATNLAPAADFRFDRQTMLESFSMANMSPQLPAFNRGVWKRLEEHVRALAVRRGSLVVVTGPIFYTNTPIRVIGESHVRIPDAFHKAVYAETNPQGMVGFVLPHEGTQAAFCAFVTNVDAVEEMTGLDFFSALPDNIETNLESKVERALVE